MKGWALGAHPDFRHRCDILGFLAHWILGNQLSVVSGICGFVEIDVSIVAVGGFDVGFVVGLVHQLRWSLHQIVLGIVVVVVGIVDVGIVAVVVVVILVLALGFGYLGCSPQRHGGFVPSFVNVVPLGQKYKTSLGWFLGFVNGWVQQPLWFQ